MPSTFKRKLQANVGTTLTTVNSYTVPASNTATIIGLSISNITTDPVLADVTVNDSTADVYLVKNAPIDAGSTLVVVGGDQKVVLEAGDSVKVKSNAATSVDVVMSILETTQ